MCELAPAPHRVADDAFVEPCANGESSLARRGLVAFQRFRESARPVLQDAWWVRSTSEPWSHSLPTTLPESTGGRLVISGADVQYPQSSTMAAIRDIQRLLPARSVA